MADWIKSFTSQFGDAVFSDVDRHVLQGVPPICLCAPHDEKQAAEVIRFAASHQIPLVPWGSAINQERCKPPPEGFITLFTSRLNKLIHHEPGDMVATVQAGMRFWDFHSAIGTGGQWLPVDAHSNSTIGGIVSANTCGPRAHGYGTLRDMVLGMTVINGDGVIRKCGGKVVKNVTGYALDKLYIGSFGTLGLITEITLKLSPLPQSGAFMEAYFETIPTGLAAMQAIALKNLPLEMLRLFSSTSSDLGYKLFASATGTHEELIRIVSDLRTVIPNFEQDEEDIMYLPHQRTTVSDFSYDRGTRAIGRHSCTPIERGATLRFGCRTSNLTSAMQILERNATQFSSIGLSDGLIDLAPLTDSEAARIASEFEKLGVNFAFENIVGVNIPNRWGSPRPEWAIMKQLKAALDPQGIMNPGRFVV